MPETVTGANVGISLHVVTESQLLTALREVVKEVGPEYTYGYFEDESPLATCQYHTDGKPRCIWGRALYKIDPSLLPRINSSIGIVLVNNKMISNSFLGHARTMQMGQDEGKMWGSLLVAFEESLARSGRLPI